MKKSKPIALDRRDVHSLLDVIGGFGAVVAVGIIAVLSVCAAFFIYRSFRGQRGKGDENNGTEATVATGEGSTARRRIKERNDRPIESTGESQDGKQNHSESGNVSTPNNTPPASEEKDLNESTLKDLEEITDELLMDMEPETGNKTDSDLDQCVEMDLDENTECEDHICHQDDDEDDDDDDSAHDVLEDLNVHSTQSDCQREETEEYLAKSVSVDTDEPSETESAQDIIYQRHEDHVTAHCRSSSDTRKRHLEEELKTTAAQDTSNKFEDHHDWRFPQTNNFDCCCYDKKTDIPEKMKHQPWFHSGNYATDAITLSPAEATMVNHNNRFDFNNYLGFQTDNTFIGVSSTPGNISQEKKADEDGASTEKKQEKNEISIMDAIMDNNEWLNVGAPEFKDRPWLMPTASLGEEKEGQAVTGLAKEGEEEEELVNKRVATVPPLSQMVNVTFRIHYITHSPGQLVAVTGSLPELGAWKSFVPLHRAKDGFWANTITLPVESEVEWKFILVVDGRICRWEECGNRYLSLTSRDEEVYLDKCWGCC